MTTPDIFNHPLPAELADDLRRLNPHWYGKPGPVIPWLVLGPVGSA